MNQDQSIGVIMICLILAVFGSGIYASVHDDMQAVAHGLIYLAMLLIIQYPIRQEIKREEEKAVEIKPTKLKYFVITIAVRGPSNKLFFHHAFHKAAESPEIMESLSIARAEIPYALQAYFISITEVSEEYFENFRI